MKRLLTVSLSAALVLVAINGCDLNRNPVGVSGADQSSPFRVIPSGESVVSATLYVYCASPSMQSVFVHRATADWVDNTATWNSFGEAFDTVSSGSFAANAPGWQTADVTALVKGWIDSTYDNFGLVLDQDVSINPRAVFFSNENVMNKPYLEVHYATDAFDSTQIFAASADAVIDGARADATGNSGGLLLTGYSLTDFEYQSLLRFDVPVVPPPPPPPPDTSVVVDTTGATDSTIVIVDTTVVVDTTEIGDGEGCTQTTNWWARHSGCGHFSKHDSVSGLLPIWLGSPDGEHSILVEENCQVSKYLMPRGLSYYFNPYAQLYSELLAAKLNIARGADGADAADAIAAADEFLADNDQSHRRRWWSRENVRRVHEWTRTLHRYNVGETGPGRCEMADRPHIFPWNL